MIGELVFVDFDGEQAADFCGVDLNEFGEAVVDSGDDEESASFIDHGFEAGDLLGRDSVGIDVVEDRDVVTRPFFAGLRESFELCFYQLDGVDVGGLEEAGEVDDGVAEERGDEIEIFARGDSGDEQNSERAFDDRNLHDGFVVFEIDFVREFWEREAEFAHAFGFGNCADGEHRLTSRERDAFRGDFFALLEER